MSRNEVSFTITGTLPPSINKLMRMHWAVRRREADEFCWKMKAAILKEDIRCLIAWRDLDRKLKIKIEVSTPNLYDEDNLNSLGKIALDQMTAMRWIKNDSPQYVEFEKPAQRQGPKAITFRISPVEES